LTVANTIELGRTFLKLLEIVSSYNHEEAIDRSRAISKPLEWDSILAKWCVVVLGEAGTGKTTEFQRQVARLVKDDKYAFFVTIEELAEKELVATLHPADSERLTRWENSTDEAMFFLDSLDEAKLHGGSLNRALITWLQAIKKNPLAARLYLSCRASDWLAETDMSVLRENFPLPQDPSDKEREARNPVLVHLAPLVENQILSLAEHLSIPCVDAFMEALSGTNAASFAQRPKDVEWLGRYWRQNKAIPTLRKLIDFNIQEKISEKPERGSELSDERCREGCESLAGIAVLTGHRSFQIPQVGLTRTEDDSIPPKQVLGSWSDKHITELLTRALFDEASFGRVKFHHRSVQEYLAARWLLSLLDRGLRRRKLEEALFPQGPAGRFLPHHLAPTAAWLALFDSSVLQKMIEIAPEHLIDEGDPDALPSETRSEILGAYVLKNQGRQHIYHLFDRASLGRFASSGLATTINKLLEDNNIGEDIKGTLAKIVADGPIYDCGENCLRIALDTSCGSKLRYSAIHAVKSAGTDAQLIRLKQLLCKGQPVLGFDLAGALVRVLFPGHISSDELVSMIRRLPRKPRNQITSLDVVLGYEVPNISSLEYRAELLKLFLSEATNGDLSAQPVVDMVWLIGPAAKLLASILDDSSEDNRPAEATEALSFFERQDQSVYGYLAGKEIRDAVERNEDVRRQLFWQRAEKKRKPNGRLPTRYWDVSDTASLFDMGVQDIKWLTKDAATHADPLAQLLAFDTLLNIIPAPTSGDEAYDNQLLNLAESDKRFSKRFERFRRAPRQPTPHYMKYRRIHEAQKLREKKQHEANKKLLEANIDDIRAGNAQNLLHYLYRKSTESMGSSYGDVDIESLRGLFGDVIAESTRAGLKEFWRGLNPKLPHERGDPTKTPMVYALGLAGVGLDIVDDINLSELSEKEISIAIRLACWELNRLPDWLSDIAAINPVFVANILSPIIRAEYFTIDIETAPTDFLRKLLSTGEPLIASLKAEILSLLLNRVPRNISALNSCLEIVLMRRPEGFHPEFGKVALRRCERAGKNNAIFASWWVAWNEIDTLKAMKYLLYRLKKARKEKAYSIVCAVLIRLESLSESCSPVELDLPKQTGTLEQMIPLVYSIVRPSDDIKHEVTYTPGSRDIAQDMRRMLVSWLINSDDPRRVAALRRLADLPVLSRERDWFLHLADEVQIPSTANQPWALDEAIKWSNRHCREPTTTKSLYQAALDRLDDIKMWVELSEYSPRELFALGGSKVQESHFQVLFASELHHRSLRHFSVAREEEVAHRRKPDIRLHSPSCGDRPIGIELKIAERWSYSELRSALKDQLVGQYLTDIDASCGILLLCSFGAKKKWKVKPGRLLSFAELVEALNKEAIETAQRSPNIEELSVVGIDFH
jgi:hypothetical protein